MSGAFCFWTVFGHGIRSHEHEDTFTPSLGAYIAQADRQTSTAGTEFMESTLNTLIGALRANRDQTNSVLKKVEQLPRRKSLSWKCAALRTHEALYSSGTRRGRRRLPEMQPNSVRFDLTRCARWRSEHGISQSKFHIAGRHTEGNHLADRHRQ